MKKKISSLPHFVDPYHYLFADPANSQRCRIKRICSVVERVTGFCILVSTGVIIGMAVSYFWLKIRGVP